VAAVKAPNLGVFAVLVMTNLSLMVFFDQRQL
jgi:hypothetical protein